MADRLRKK